VQTPVRYPATVVAASRQPALARDFVLFLNQPPARAVFTRYGFGTP
jgi:molybdate transport system substrate-binding protein